LHPANSVKDLKTRPWFLNETMYSSFTENSGQCRSLSIYHCCRCQIVICLPNYHI